MSRGKSDPSSIILDAALETIFTDKISGARLRQVARNAGMSQGNLHYYFPTKEELYRSLLDHLLDIFVDERKTILEDQTIPPRDKLCYFFEQQIQLIQRQKEVVIFFDFWVQGTADEEIRRKISGMYQKWRQDVKGVIDQGIQEGEFSGIQASQVPALLASIMDGASLQYRMDETAIDLQDYFNTAYKMILAMLTLD
jgi:AcrR family transcriptional regulator